MGDVAELTHVSALPGREESRGPFGGRPAASPDASRWAIVLGDQDFDDQSLTRLAVCPSPTRNSWRDALVKRYRVPAEQALVLTDESLVRLEQAIPDRLAKIGAEGEN